MSRAAADQHVTQPSLTRSVRKLEQYLGMKLLERGPRGVAPTRYGEILAERARIIVNESRHVLQELDAMRTGRAGHVRLGIATSAASDGLGASLARLLTERSTLAVTLDIGFPEIHLAMLRAGGLDAAITTYPPDDEADLRFEPLASFDLVIVARPTHPLAKAVEPLSLEELARCQWAVHNQAHAAQFYRRLLRRTAKDVDMVRARCSSFAMIRSLLLNGDFVTLIARPTVQEDLSTGRLVVLPTAVPTIRVELSIVTRALAHPTTGLSLCLQEITRVFAPSAVPRKSGQRSSAARAPARRGGKAGS